MAFKPGLAHDSCVIDIDGFGEIDKYAKIIFQKNDDSCFLFVSNKYGTCTIPCFSANSAHTALKKFKKS